MPTSTPCTWHHFFVSAKGYFYRPPFADDVQICPLAPAVRGNGPPPVKIMLWYSPHPQQERVFLLFSTQQCDWFATPLQFCHSNRFTPCAWHRRNTLLQHASQSYPSSLKGESTLFRRGCARLPYLRKRGSFSRSAVVAVWGKN